MINIINKNSKNIIALSLIFNFLHSNDYVFETKWCISTFSEFKNNLKNIFCIVDYRVTEYVIYMILVAGILYALTILCARLDRQYLVLCFNDEMIRTLITLSMILLVNNLVFNIYSSIFPWFAPQISGMLMINKCLILALSIVSYIHLCIVQYDDPGLDQHPILKSLLGPDRPNVSSGAPRSSYNTGQQGSYNQGY